MKEQEWLTSSDIRSMLEFVAAERKADNRRLRLFSVACCRRHWECFPDERSRTAIEVSERYADKLVGKKPLTAARRAAFSAMKQYEHRVYYTNTGVEGEPANAIKSLATLVALDVSDAGVDTMAELVAGHADSIPYCTDGQAGKELEQRCQAALLRDIVNPFRPSKLDPSWLVWNGG